MPRRARIALADVPLHVIQRGNNRQACFFTDDDYRFYLDQLRQCAQRAGCAAHVQVRLTRGRGMLRGGSVLRMPWALDTIYVRIYVHGALMGQVTIYLDEETQSLMKRAVRNAGVSQSRWIARVIREKIHGEWPADVAALAGAWPDALTAEEIRAAYSVDETGDAKRETL